MFAGLSEAFNALNNIGADMSPATRAKAKKVVISAIIVTQVAVSAVNMAQMTAGGSTRAVRNKD